MTLAGRKKAPHAFFKGKPFRPLSLQLPRKYWKRSPPSWHLWLSPFFFGSSFSYPIPSIFNPFWPFFWPSKKGKKMSCWHFSIGKVRSGALSPRRPGLPGEPKSPFICQEGREIFPFWKRNVTYAIWYSSIWALYVSKERSEQNFFSQNFTIHVLYVRPCKPVSNFEENLKLGNEKIWSAYPRHQQQ